MSAPLIGIDLVELARIEALLARENGLRETLFCAGELAYCEAQHRPLLHLAARYAAKEAVVKALGIEGGWDPHEIEVTAGAEQSGLRLHGSIRERSQQLGVALSISMTHQDSMAAAVALAQPIAVCQEIGKGP